MASNSLTDSRTGVLVIGSHTFTVYQGGAKSDSPPKPEKPETVEVDGSVGALSGGCPSVTFKVSGATVVTAASTKFKHGSCGDLRNGGKVKVKGQKSQSGLIQADEIELEKRQ